MVTPTCSTRVLFTNLPFPKLGNPKYSLRSSFRPKSVAQELTTPVHVAKTWWQSPYDAQIFQLVIPTICSNVLTPLSQSIDAGVVGRLGVAQMSGVGLASTALVFITSFLSAIPLLMTPLIAQKDARGEDASSDIAQGIKFTFLIGILAGLFAFCSADMILNVLQPSVESRPFALVYLRTLALAPPVSLVLYCLGGVFRGLKDSQSVLRAALLGVGINFTFDFLFVFGFKWSVMGVGLATILALYTSTGYLIHRLITLDKLKVKDLFAPLDVVRFLPLLSDGLRLGMRAVLLFGVFLTAATVIARSGVIVHSAHEICRQTAVLTYTIYASIEQTVQALGATALGYKDLQMGRSVIRRALQLSVGICSLTVLTLCALSKQVAGFYTANPAVMAAFLTVAPFHLLTMPLTAFVSVIDGALIGAQRSGVVANAQSVGAALGILCLFFLHQKGLVTLLSVWIIIRAANSMHGVVTGHYLFFSERSPYGFVSN